VAKKSAPRSLASCLLSAAQASDVRFIRPSTAVRAVWPQVVGRTLAERSRVSSWERGVLRVVCATEADRRALTELSTTIARLLPRRFGRGPIARVEVTVGEVGDVSPLPGAQQAQGAPVRPTAEELALADRTAGAIGDDGLRAAFSAFMAKGLAARRREEDHEGSEPSS
jgi:hypothetical protein